MTEEIILERDVSVIASKEEDGDTGRKQVARTSKILMETVSGFGVTPGNGAV